MFSHIQCFSRQAQLVWLDTTKTAPPHCHWSTCPMSRHPAQSTVTSLYLPFHHSCELFSHLPRRRNAHNGLRWCPINKLLTYSLLLCCVSMDDALRSSILLKLLLYFINSLAVCNAWWFGASKGSCSILQGVHCLLHVQISASGTGGSSLCTLYTTRY